MFKSTQRQLPQQKKKRERKKEKGKERKNERTEKTHIKLLHIESNTYIISSVHCESSNEKRTSKQRTKKNTHTRGHTQMNNGKNISKVNGGQSAS